MTFSDEGEVSVPYWSLSNTESLHSIHTSSVMAREVLERLEQHGSSSEGTITLPDAFTNFGLGKISSAIGAARFSIKWHEDRVDIKEKDFFYITDKQKASYGTVE